MHSEPIAVLDIGGEGRHPEAWNLNPSAVQTFGPHRGEPIPRWIEGRADAIPLSDSTVHEIIVERTPLLEKALEEIRRVAIEGARIILRHAIPPRGDPHALARRVLGEPVSVRLTAIGSRTVQESVFVREKR